MTQHSKLSLRRQKQLRRFKIVQAVYIAFLICLLCSGIALLVFTNSSLAFWALMAFTIGMLAYPGYDSYKAFVDDCDDFDYSKEQFVIGTIQSVVLDFPGINSHYGFSVRTTTERGTSNTVIPVSEEDCASYALGDLIIFQCTTYYDESDDTELFRKYEVCKTNNVFSYSCELSFVSEEQGKKKCFLRAKENHNKTFILELPQDLELPQELALGVNAEINVTVKTYWYTVFETICVKQLPGHIFSKDGSILHIVPINNWKDGSQP